MDRRDVGVFAALNRRDVDAPDECGTAFDRCATDVAIRTTACDSHMAGSARATTTDASTTIAKSALVPFKGEHADRASEIGLLSKPSGGACRVGLTFLAVRGIAGKFYRT